MLIYGYKPEGEARLFDLEDGAVLSPPWSPDISVIQDPEKRTAEAVSKAAGGSAVIPVTVAAGGNSGPIYGPPPPHPVKVPFDRAAHMRKLQAAAVARRAAIAGNNGHV